MSAFVMLKGIADTMQIYTRKVYYLGCCSALWNRDYDAYFISAQSPMFPFVEDTIIHKDNTKNKIYKVIRTWFLF